MDRVETDRPARRLRILVVQQGAPSRGGSGWTDADGPVLVMQMKSEAPKSFEQRVLERLALAERDGCHFSVATLLTGTPGDVGARLSEERIALALAAHCSKSEGAELYLEGPLASELGVATPLVALADKVRAAAGGKVAVQLSLRELSAPSAGADSAFWRVETRRYRAS